MRAQKLTQNLRLKLIPQKKLPHVKRKIIQAQKTKRVNKNSRLQKLPLKSKKTLSQKFRSIRKRSSLFLAKRVVNYLVKEAVYSTPRTMRYYQIIKCARRKKVVLPREKVVELLPLSLNK